MCSTALCSFVFLPFSTKKILRRTLKSLNWGETRTLIERSTCFTLHAARTLMHHLHVFSMHGCVWLVGPTQSLPVAQIRCRTWVPAPHVAEQVVQSVHCPHLGPGEEKSNHSRNSSQHRKKGSSHLKTTLQNHHTDESQLAGHTINRDGNSMTIKHNWILLIYSTGLVRSVV